ncbi:serine/threonine protein kinase [Melittangium boletus]|uniref:serine/threonine protein kinase n=1 Tax=Melittangium boletus TaxID=83453 RepID=UPI003DA49BEA
MHDGRAGQRGAAPGGVGLTPGSQVAGFTLIEPLSRGSSGQVFLAERGGQRFALKVVPLGSWGEREVDALRRVRDASVVRLLGYAQWPEAEPRFLVLEMEWVHGPPLDVWAREAPPTAAQWVERVLLPLTRALGQVHVAGVVHRDVKEANIVVRQEDGRPVLVDFGSAAYEGSPRLTQRLPPGTPEYRSPEMLRFAREWEGEPYVSRPSDDWWALGVTLYTLLTRVLPFGDRHGPLVRDILQRAPEPPHARNPRVPPALGQVCLRMLEKEPPARYADAAALTQALEDALRQADASWHVPLFEAERPCEAAPEAVPRTPWRGRRRVALAAGLGVAVAGLWVGARGGTSPSGSGPSTPRATSPHPLPAQQDGFWREVAPATKTAEVGPGAKPLESPSPAPVAPATPRENPPMRKPPPGRSSLPATLVAAAACVGAACASTPRPPPAEECPAGSEATRRRFRLGLEQGYYVGSLKSLGEFYKFESEFTTVRNGQDSTLLVLATWGDIPNHATLSGRVYFEQGLVQARYTRLLLPSGESFPVCAMFREPEAPQADATPDKASIYTTVEIWFVPRFR